MFYPSRNYDRNYDLLCLVVYGLLSGGSCVLVYRTIRKPIVVFTGLQYISSGDQLSLRPWARDSDGYHGRYGRRCRVRHPI